MIVFKAGRLAPHDPATHPRLRLPLRTMPSLPADVDYISAVTDWPMYLNDQLGCCTISAQGHMEEAWSHYGSGTTVEVTDKDILGAYEAVSGYRPGDPSTDGGAVMQDVLAFIHKTGLGGHKIAAYAQVDHTNPTEVKQALYLCGHVYVGVNLPQSAMNQFDAGQDWDVMDDDGGILGGHAINCGAVMADGTYRIITWGRVVKVTQAWWAKYVEEAWCSISLEWLSKTGTAPEGLDLATLGADYAALTGEPDPFPAPVPPGPAPSPTPVADPDAALVTALRPWLAERHTGVNHRAAEAVDAWMDAKGYSTAG